MTAASDQALPTFPVLQLLYHSPSCFASSQFVHEVRNRQLISFFFSGAFEPLRNTVGKKRDDDSLANKSSRPWVDYISCTDNEIDGEAAIRLLSHAGTARTFFA